MKTNDTWACINSTYSNAHMPNEIRIQHSTMYLRPRLVLPPGKKTDLIQSATCIL